MLVSRALPPAAGRSTSLRAAQRGIDLFGARHDKIDIHLKDKEYQGIDRVHAGRMLGYFTQHMQDQGFPWRLYEGQEASDGGFTRGASVGDLQALMRLERGEPVLFQPLRNLQLDLSSNSLEALAAAQSLGGATDVSKITKLAAVSKGGPAGSLGIEIRFGEPLVVSGYGELKLLYQMYNPDEKVKTESPVGKSAHQLSYFTQGRTATSAFPWRFYEKSESGAFSRTLGALVRQGFAGALVGAAASSVIGLPLALFKSWELLPGTLAVGAGIGAVIWGFQGARTAYKGEPLNAVVTLEKILNGQEAVFQETHVHSIPVPLIRNLAFVWDHGTGSPIRSPEELDTFFWMQNQAAKLPEEEKPKEEPKDPPQIIVIQDNRSYDEHHHLGRESHLHSGDEHHHHPIIVAR